MAMDVVKMALSGIRLIKIIVFLIMVDVCLAEGVGESSQPAIPMCGQISAFETVLLNPTVDSNLESASFVLVWSSPKSVLKMDLTSPSGIKYDSSVQPPVIYGSDGAVTYYIVPNPEEGDWTVAITAEDVPECGESYCFTLDISGDVEVANGADCPVCNQPG
jgi:hypothetical protein